MLLDARGASERRTDLGDPAPEDQHVDTTVRLVGTAGDEAHQPRVADEQVTHAHTVVADPFTTRSENDLTGQARWRPAIASAMARVRSADSTWRFSTIRPL